jgi:MerR family transcriptional regulator/heat shock protein HspR
MCYNVGAREERQKVASNQSPIPRYVISVAARLVGVAPHTLRLYEQKGLLQPARLHGRNRLYSDADIVRLRRIAELARQGVNPAGIKLILEMEERSQADKLTI